MACWRLADRVVRREISERREDSSRQRLMEESSGNEGSGRVCGVERRWRLGAGVEASETEEEEKDGGGKKGGGRG